MSNDFTKGAPLPKALGRCADLYHEVRSVRLAMEKEVEAVKARESEIKEHIIANLSKSDDTGAAGLRYRAQIITKTKFVVKEWPVLFSWIRKHDRFDMLQKRISDTAVADFVEEEKRLLPGTERVQVPELSVTKI